MESYIQRSPHATTFVGPEASQLFAAAALRSAINLYIRTGIRANRAYTVTAMSDAVTRITGKHYPRSKTGLAVAADDLQAWIEMTKAQIRVINNAY